MAIKTERFSYYNNMPYTRKLYKLYIINISYLFSANISLAIRHLIISLTQCDIADSYISVVVHKLLFARNLPSVPSIIVKYII